MADKVETSMGSDESFSFTMGDGNTPSSVKRDSGESIETNPLDNMEEEDDNGTSDTVDGEGGEASEEAEETDAGQDATAATELGDFSEDRVEEWDAQYRPDGKLDKDRLTAEFDKNASSGTPGLNEATYAYLESAMGLSKGTVKDIEAALQVQREAASKEPQKLLSEHDAKVVEAAGDVEALQAAVAWGKSGGYDDAAKERFNTIMNGTDLQAKLDATDALMARYAKANPKKAKPALPQRDATKGQGKPNPGVAPFKTRDEYRAAREAAGDNKAKLALVGKRLLASEF